VFVEYAGLVSALALLSATLSGAFGQNVGAVFASDSAAVVAAGKAARAQGVPPRGAKAAYKRAPYAKTPLRYLYALGWIGGTKNRAQCALSSLSEDAARRQAERELRAKPALVAQLRRRAVTVPAAARALVAGFVSACS
jgi:hypothetical protein